MNKPSKCPACGKDYLTTSVRRINDDYVPITLEIERCQFCHCPIYYIHETNDKEFHILFPISSNVDISEEIKNLSPDFLNCFTESMEALAHKLKNIVGAGLRKSLEFLVTDYLVKVQDKQNISKLNLWEKIKLLEQPLYATASANIARLIGNDYTHIENLNGSELQELIDNIELTADLMTTRLRAIKAENRLKEMEAEANQK